MKKLNYIILHTVCLVLFACVAPAWNGDVLVHAGQPSASHSMSAKANGTLYVCVPVDSGNGVYAVITYQSSDNGDTWVSIPFPNAVSSFPILKTKMVTTGSDSVYCLYLTGSAVSILNVETGAIGQFNTVTVGNFDAAASPNGNVIYLFANVSGLFDIRRYGTLDGGITWTGNTALVTGNGYNPKVYMTGTRLILNYYGPVLPDTSSSVIRAAFYDEGTPGTITPGTFQDVVTNTAVKKKEFMSVIYSNILWFLFAEGDVQQVLKCRVSNDNGATYGPEFTVGGNAITDAYNFNAHHYTNATGGGCYLTFFSDSILLPPPFDPMVITQATVLNPSSFGAAIPYNDFTVITVPSYKMPVVIPFTNGASPDVGVSWIEQDIVESVYFDRLSNITSVNGTNIPPNVLLSVMPNPAQEQIRVTFRAKKNDHVRITLNDVTGKTVAVLTEGYYVSGVYILNADVKNFPKGIYTMQLTTDNVSSMLKLAKY